MDVVGSASLAWTATPDCASRAVQSAAVWGASTVADVAPGDVPATTGWVLGDELLVAGTGEDGADVQPTTRTAASPMTRTRKRVRSFIRRRVTSATDQTLMPFCAEQR